MKSYEQDIFNLIRGIKPTEEKVEDVKVEEVKEEEQVDEAMAGEIHPMALHVKSVQKDGKPMYQVHAVGKKLAGGISKGEHLSDSDLDDATEMGAKIKHMKEEQIDELKKSTLASYAMKAADQARVKKDAAIGYVRQRKGMVSTGEVQKSAKADQRIAGVKSAIARLAKEETEEAVDFTVIEHNAFSFELPEKLNYTDYLNAAKKFTEKDEDAVTIADQFFKEQDESLVIESFTRGDIESKINAHAKAGHQISLPKYSTKDGKPYAEYTVTNKETGQKTKYIHHGSTRRVERM